MIEVNSVDIVKQLKAGRLSDGIGHISRVGRVPIACVVDPICASLITTKPSRVRCSSKWGNQVCISYTCEDTKTMISACAVAKIETIVSDESLLTWYVAA